MSSGESESLLGSFLVDPYCQAREVVDPNAGDKGTREAQNKFNTKAKIRQIMSCAHQLSKTSKTIVTNVYVIYRNVQFIKMQQEKCI